MAASEARARDLVFFVPEVEVGAVMGERESLIRSVEAAGASLAGEASGAGAAGSWCQRSVAWSCSRVIWRAVNMDGGRPWRATSNCISSTGMVPECGWDMGFRLAYRFPP